MATQYNSAAPLDYLSKAGNSISNFGSNVGGKIKNFFTPKEYSSPRQFSFSDIAEIPKKTSGYITNYDPSGLQQWEMEDILDNSGAGGGILNGISGFMKNNSGNIANSIQAFSSGANQNQKTSQLNNQVYQNTANAIRDYYNKKEAMKRKRLLGYKDTISSGYNPMFYQGYDQQPYYEINSNRNYQPMYQYQE